MTKLEKLQVGDSYLGVQAWLSVSELVSAQWKLRQIKYQNFKKEPWEDDDTCKGKKFKQMGILDMMPWANLDTRVPYIRWKSIIQSSGTSFEYYSNNKYLRRKANFIKEMGRGWNAPLFHYFRCHCAAQKPEIFTRATKLFKNSITCRKQNKIKIKIKIKIKNSLLQKPRTNKE